MSEINDAAVEIIHRIDQIIRIHSGELPEFIYNSKFYNEFILPVSLALVMQANCDLYNEKAVSEWCIQIDSVEFMSVNNDSLNPSTQFYPDYVYRLDDFGSLRSYMSFDNICIKESYKSLLTKWNIHIPLFRTQTGYINLLLYVYKDIKIAENMLMNIPFQTLRAYMKNTIENRMSALLTGNDSKSNYEILCYNLNFIKDKMTNDAIQSIIIKDIKKLVDPIIEKENKSENEIEGLALILKALKIIGYGDDNENISL